MEITKVMETLCLIDAPGGSENKLINIIKELFVDLGEVKLSNLNNIYVEKSGRGKGKILLMAHSDEVFLIVNGFEGRYLKFKCWGIDNKTLYSQEVTIHGKNEISGVIVNKNKSDNDDNIELVIDTGYDEIQIKEQVKIGDIITIKRDFYRLLNNCVACKAIDDRAGVGALYACYEYLKDKNHDLDVYFVFSSGEELGSRGASSACYDIEPDLGVAIDVTFDSGAFGDKDRDNGLSKGPVVCLGPSMHTKLKDRIIEVAKKNNLAYQLEVEPGNNGTDQWDMQVYGKGVPSLLISIPIKYMHTSVEVVCIDDIVATGELIGRFIEDIKIEEMEGLFCF